MKYPSERLHDLADGFDRWEDRALDAYGSALLWLSGFPVWRYPGIARKLAAAETDAKTLRRGYRDLAALYREKTGEEPPDDPEVWWALNRDDALASMRRALNEMGRRLLETFGGGRS